MGTMSPPDYVNQLNLSHTGGRLCPPNYYLPPPGFSDLPTALLSLPHTLCQNKDKLLCDIDLHVECSSGTFYCYYLLRVQLLQKDIKA